MFIKCYVNKISYKYSNKFIPWAKNKRLSIKLLISQKIKKNGKKWQNRRWSQKWSS